MPFMRRALVLAALGLTFVCGSAGAEIEKFADTNCNGICFYWWPKLPQLKGWHQDEAGSRKYRANILAPDGSNFMTAETIMYAKANYKPRTPEIKTLRMLIEDDKRNFRDADPGIRITDAPALKTADGQSLKSFYFFPAKPGSWERVSYGEEGDFYLIFTVSSHSKTGLEAAKKDYETLVGDYRS